MKNTWMTIALVAAALSVGACGKDKKSDDNAAAGKTTEAPKTAGPAIDCTAHAAKMTECLEPFAAAYAKTKNGGRSAKGADGVVDVEKAAKNYKTLWGMQGAKICTGESGVTTAYAEHDAPWKKRLAACDNAAACDVWAPCMATALGEML